MNWEASIHTALQDAGVSFSIEILIGFLIMEAIFIGMLFICKQDSEFTPEDTEGFYSIILCLKGVSMIVAFGVFLVSAGMVAFVVTAIVFITLNILIAKVVFKDRTKKKEEKKK